MSVSLRRIIWKVIYEIFVQMRETLKKVLRLWSIPKNISENWTSST